MIFGAATRKLTRWVPGRPPPKKLQGRELIQTVSSLMKSHKISQNLMRSLNFFGGVGGPKRVILERE